MRTQWQWQLNAPTIEVGRSQPNSEIADLAAYIQHLDNDIQSYKPKQGDGIDVTNWATLNHRSNILKLNWGQFQTQLAHDYWWGDDDETTLSNFKTEYNQLRSDFLAYVAGQTSVPAVDPSSPVLEEQEKKDAENGSIQQQAFDVVKKIAYGGAILAASYFILPVLLPKIAHAFTKKD